MSRSRSTAGVRYAFLTATCLAWMAFGLRVFQLAANSLWEDEIFTAVISAQPVAELLKWTAGDVHPPGYYLLAGGLAQLFGWLGWPPSQLTDWLWRFPSVVAGTLAVAVTYRLGADWFGRRVGIGAALLLAVSPLAVRYSQEARMHELFLLLAALSTWALSRAITTHQTRKRRACWLAYAAATTASLYTVYLGFVVLVIQVTWVAMYWRRRPRASSTRGIPLHFLASVLLALIAYLPWWPVVVNMLQERLAQHGAEVAAGIALPLTFAGQVVGSLGPGEGLTSWLGLALWVAGLVAAGRRRPDLALLGGLWIVLPLALVMAFGDPRAQHMRYAFLLPLYALFVTHGTAALVRQLRLTDRAAAAFFYASVVVLAILSAVNLPGAYRQAKTGWRPAAEYLAERARPGDVIIHDGLFDAGRYLGYYYRGMAEIATPAVFVATLPERLPGMRASGGRVWAVTRFEPRPVAAIRPVVFPGLVISEPKVPVYEPELLTIAMIDLMQQAVEATPDWVARVTAAGIMAPDPRVARAANNLYLGDVLRVAGHLPEAIAAYEAVVFDDPSASGYAALAEAYQEAGRDEAAVWAYQEAVARQPKWQGPASVEASALATAGRWTAAAEVYQAIVFPQ